MKTAEEIKKEIAKLEVKYNASTTRNVYRIGEQLRKLRAELASIK